MFLISVFGLHARGVTAPNVMIGCLIFYGGVGQFIAGIMEFITGNTVSYFVLVYRLLCAVAKSKRRTNSSVPPFSHPMAPLTCHTQ
jgi:succinate-acetate transporter protein